VFLNAADQTFDCRRAGGELAVAHQTPPFTPTAWAASYRPILENTRFGVGEDDKKYRE